MRIKRFMYRSQIKVTCLNDFISLLKTRKSKWISRLKQQGVSTCSIFASGPMLFVYVEANSDFQQFAWEDHDLEYLEPWPGEKSARYAVPMLDIYHRNKPVPERKWRIEENVVERVGSLARLKADMFSSYVFFHFQLQEEQPGNGNKTYLIGSHERYIFSYAELPKVIEIAPPGKLSTNHSPGNWQEIMKPHFDQWEDLPEGENNWRALEEIISF